MARSGRHGALDLDEIAPNQFLVHNAHANNLLKGEGRIKGRFFELTTWRREGLLARLRDRGYQVRTLADRVAALPAPPPPPPIGGTGWRPLVSTIEQLSHFDLLRLGWHTLAPEQRDGAAGVTIYDGWVLRRRKGRGPASYYLALKERGGGIGLRPLDETAAILSGIAQAIARDPRPLMVERRRAPGSDSQGDQLLLPQIELPPAYRATLELISSPSPEGPLVTPANWPLAEALFDRLGIRLQVEGE
jgi:hypothetical protein